jgi:hypothetical protein
VISEQGNKEKYEKMTTKSSYEKGAQKNAKHRHLI